MNGFEPSRSFHTQVPLHIQYVEDQPPMTSQVASLVALMIGKSFTRVEIQSASHPQKPIDNIVCAFVCVCISSIFSNVNLGFVFGLKTFLSIMLKRVI